MTELSIERRNDPGPEWPPLVARLGGGFYHEPAWMAALSAGLRLPLHVLVAHEARQAVGGLALMEVPALPGAPFGRRRLVSLPFSYAAGPLAPDARVAEALAADALALARERRIGRVELKWWPRVEPQGTAAPAGSTSTAPENSAPPVAPGFQRVERYATYRVPPEPEAALWRRLDRSSTQRGIRKAEKTGVRVVVGEDDAAWTAMAGLQARTAQRHGLPAPPTSFFRQTCRTLQHSGHARLYLAYAPPSVTESGEAPPPDTPAAPAGGVVVWRGAREHIYAFGADDPRAREHRIMHALLWRAMRDAAADGATFDLGRAAPEQDTLVQFKTRWGGVPVPLRYDMWPAAGGLQHAARNGPAARAFAAFWRRLPPAAADRGAALYRYLG